ncbi:TRAP transporter small permease subunit [Puniceibacterium sp. IMCC21224]|uniref:TRAP transporter small permease subunit n=1 Tax=Puniceibacterium sp. IMCC21224 TaxID=1618204 RepID=UPI00065D35F9|nr:TRAP transporter small permease [Puniceibacterium sp. IMCC21224]KMK64551.1 TRAP-type mannitol/chloroaromatic compound transport system, small permease component [Puniceibacterium sp. IMCC21224]
MIRQDIPIPREDALAPSSKLAERVRSYLEAATSACCALGSVTILIVMTLVNLDVFGRSLLNKPVTGVNEIVSSAVVAIVYLQIAQSLRSGKLTRSQAFIKGLARLSPLTSRIFDFCIFIVGALFFCVLTVLGARATGQAYEQGKFVGTTGIFELPIWPVYVLMVMGCSLTVMQFIAVGLERLRPQHQTPTGDDI